MIIIRNRQLSHSQGDKFIRREDLIVRENNLGHPANRIEMASHEGRSIVWGPEDHGAGVARKRRLHAQNNMATTVWLGPPADKVQEDFEQLFKRRRVITGNMYFQDSDQRILEEATVRGRKLHKYLSEEAKVEDIDFKQLLFPGETQRLKAYRPLAAEKSDLTGDFLADISQWPEHGDCGPIISCLTTSSLIWKFNGQERMATSREHLFAQGIVPFDVRLDEDIMRAYGCPFTAGLARLSVEDRRHLAGQGMHLHAMQAWTLYNMANLMPKKLLEKVNLVGEAALALAVSSTAWPAASHGDGDRDSDDSGNLFLGFHYGRYLLLENEHHAWARM